MPRCEHPQNPPNFTLVNPIFLSNLRHMHTVGLLVQDVRYPIYQCDMDAKGIVILEIFVKTTVTIKWKPNLLP